MIFATSRTPASGFDSCLRDWVDFVVDEIGQDPTQTPEWFYGEVKTTLRNEHGVIRRAIDRGKPYVPTIKFELRKQNIPEILHYLASIESGYKEKAGSPAGAEGMWQFIKGTAVRYDLKVTDANDEREDWEKATEAAKECRRCDPGRDRRGALRLAPQTPCGPSTSKRS